MSRNPDDLIQFKVRCREDLRSRLETAANQHDTSINAEIVARLERSFELEKQLGGESGIALFRSLAHAMSVVEYQIGDWRVDRAAFFAAEHAIKRAMAAMRPLPAPDIMRAYAPLDTELKKAEARLDALDAIASHRFFEGDPGQPALRGLLVRLAGGRPLLDGNLTESQTDNLISEKGLEGDDADILREYHQAKRAVADIKDRIDAILEREVIAGRAAAAAVDQYLEQWLNPPGTEQA